MQAKMTSPRWADLPGTANYAGLSVGTIRNADRAGLIRSALVRVSPTNKRGRRLIDLRSVDAWIESCVGGEADLPHLIEANRKSHAVRRAGKRAVS